MASFALTDYDATFGGTDLSAYIQSITLDMSADMLDDTAMGDTARTRLGGLNDSTVTVTFIQDHAAGAVDATLGGNEGTSFALVLKPTSGSVTATNPSYSVTAILESYSPVGNTVGDLALAQATFQGAGAVTRATS